MAHTHCMPATSVAMKGRRGPVVSLFVLVLVAHTAQATSSTTFWTPMTIDFQPYGVPHLGIDNYFKLSKAAPNGAFPTDITSPTIGLLPFNKIQAEAGIDYFANTPHPWLYNFKIGTPENSFFKGQPALEVGTFLVGRRTRTDRTDYDILYAVVGKSLGAAGRVSGGPYIGNHATLVSGGGKAENVGYMVAYDRGFCHVKNGDFNRFVLAMDYASGRNFIGGGGGGVYIYFSKDVSLLLGPTFFNDKDINGGWKWSTQLDINLPNIFRRHRDH
jgi:hypothetical protein